MSKRGVDIKKVISFFAALSGGGIKTKRALEGLKKRQMISDKDMGDILEKARLGLEKVANEIKDESTRRWIYREAYIAAYLDRKITNKERKALRKIQEVLGLGKGVIRDIERWVESFSRIMEKGKNIIFG